MVDAQNSQKLRTQPQDEQISKNTFSHKNDTTRLTKSIAIQNKSDHIKSSINNTESINLNNENAHPFATNATCAFVSANNANTEQANTTQTFANNVLSNKVSTKQANAVQHNATQHTTKTTIVQANATSSGTKLSKVRTKTHIKLYPSAKYILLWLFAFIICLIGVSLMGAYHPNNQMQVETVIAVDDDQKTSTSLSGGGTSEEDPFLISSPADLRLLSTTTDYETYWGSSSSSRVYYKMTEDITINTSKIDWVPIGNSNNKFYGTFDGDGHSITFSSAVNLEKVQYAGLFGYFYVGTIKNLGVNWNNGLSATYSSGETYAGGIVAYIYNSSTINNCYATGSVNISANISFESSYAGGILGYSKSATISNCYNNCNVILIAIGHTGASSDASAGGIAGSCSSISKSYNSGDITSKLVSYNFATSISTNYRINKIFAYNAADGVWNNYAGGIVGGSSIYSGTVKNCYNKGNVSAICTLGDSSVLLRPSAGGIFGGKGSISNCYNTGSVCSTYTATSFHTATSYAGGILGYSGTVKNCFSVVESEEYQPTATAPNGTAYSGGIVGSGSTSGCYFNYGTSTGEATGGVKIEGLTDLMKDANNYSSSIGTTGYTWDSDSNYTWDLTSSSTAVWVILPGENDGLPVLRAFYNADYIISCTDDLIAFSTNGISGLQDFANAWGSSTFSPNIIVTQDILVESSDWTPIGNSTTPFYGTFDGGGHLITFKKSITVSGTYAGLFGFVGDATIESLGVNWAGGDGDTTFGLSNTWGAGGIVGRVGTNVTINKCFATGSICGSGYSLRLGGICGAPNSDSATITISNCYSSVYIKATGYTYYEGFTPSDGAILSGIVSSNRDNTFNTKITVFNCYNLGKLYSDGPASEACGIATRGTITNCFSAVGNIANIDATYIYAIADTSTQTNCYYDYTKSTPSDSAYAVQIENLAELMKVQSNYSGTIDNTGYSWNTAEQFAWNFSTTWVIDSTRNNSYPILRAFYDLVITYQDSASDPTKVEKRAINFSDNAVIESNSMFKRAGYFYNKWTTDGVNFYDCGSSMKFSNNVILYPNWEENPKIVITFASDSANSKVLVSIVADSQIIGQVVARDGVSYVAQVENGASISLIFSASYYAQFNFTSSENIQIINRQVHLQTLANTTINYTITNRSDFNNSIVL